MRKLTILLALAGLLFSCSSDTDNVLEFEEEDLFLAAQTLQDATNAFYGFIESEQLDAMDALDRTAQYLTDSVDGVEAATVFDEVYLNIVSVGGFSTQIFLDYKDEDGLSERRGGPSGGDVIEAFGRAAGCPDKIENTKVLLYGAAVEDFYAGSEYQTLVVDRLRNSDRGLQVTTLTGALCSPEALGTLDQYGLVIIDSHGYIDAFLTGLKVEFDPLGTIYVNLLDWKETIEDQIGAGNFIRLLKQELRYVVKINVPEETAPGVAPPPTGFLNITVTTKGLRSYLPDLDNTVVFGNMCYSGWNATENRAGFPIGNGFTGPMRQTFLDKNPITYYAFAAGDQTQYSYAVPNGFAREVQTQLIDRLVDDADCTQDAHLQDNGNEMFFPFNPEKLGTEINVGALIFNHYGKSGYGYNECGTYTDDRDGTVYQLACIDGETWFAENLRYEVEGSEPPPEWDPGRGYYYTEEAAYNGEPRLGIGTNRVQGVCPDGWHLPNRDDWAHVFDAIGFDYIPEQPNITCPHGFGNGQPREVSEEFYPVIQLLSESGWTHHEGVTEDPMLNAYGLSIINNGSEIITTSALYHNYAYDNDNCYVYITDDFEDGPHYVDFQPTETSYKMRFRFLWGGSGYCRCVKD